MEAPGSAYSRPGRGELHRRSVSLWWKGSYEREGPHDCGQPVLGLAWYKVVEKPVPQKNCSGGKGKGTLLNATHFADIVFFRLPP